MRVQYAPTQERYASYYQITSHDMVKSHYTKANQRPSTLALIQPQLCSSPPGQPGLDAHPLESHPIEGQVDDLPMVETREDILHLHIQHVILLRLSGSPGGGQVSDPGRDHHFPVWRRSETCLASDVETALIDEGVELCVGNGRLGERDVGVLDEAEVGGVTGSH